MTAPQTDRVNLALALERAAEQQDPRVVLVREHLGLSPSDAAAFAFAGAALTDEAFRRQLQVLTEASDRRAARQVAEAFGADGVPPQRKVPLPLDATVVQDLGDWLEAYLGRNS